MSNSPRNLPVASISIPAPVVNALLREIAQAHCSLGVLVELLRGNGQPDPGSLAFLLEYIETALEKSDQTMNQYMAQTH